MREVFTRSRGEAWLDGARCRVGIYDAYLHTLGGGENLLAVLAQCLERELPGATLDLITHGDEPAGLEPIVERFGVELKRTRIRRLELNSRRGPYPLRRLLHEQDIARVSGEYDLFVNGTIFSLVPSRARHSLYVCMFPLNPVPVALRRAEAAGRSGLLRAPYLFARRAALRYCVGRYDRILSISEFTRSWVRAFWRMDSYVVYPPVDTASALHLDRKRKRILAVGRFFPGDHNKKHDVMIKAFARLVESGLDRRWELHLAGGRTQVAGTKEYLQKLRRMARGLPVQLHVDADRRRLAELFATSSLFWHATGYGEDEAEDPYKLEHFGISTVEAMSHGCVPLVYAAGGQPEVVEDGVSGFLWRDLATLSGHTLSLAEDQGARERLARAAHVRSQEFNRAAFAARVHQVLSELLTVRARRPGGRGAAPLSAADRLMGR